MYDLQFVATSSADWAQAIQLIDDDTGLALDLTGISFEIEVHGRSHYHHGGARLSLSSADGSISVPAAGVIQWIVPASQMAGFRDCATYRVGCVMTGPGGTTQLFTGALALLDGDVS